MKLVSVSTHRSPDDAANVRITGLVESAAGEKIDIWYEVPSGLESELSDTGNPWLIAMLPYAVKTGEALTMSLPVDPELLENVKGLVATWCNWYPELFTPKIEVPTMSTPALAPNRRTVAFFSGGVDSWFTALRHIPELESAAIGQVDDLLIVHGFDISVYDKDEFAILGKTLLGDAKKVNRNLIVVRTNLRKYGSLWASRWGLLTNSPGLASVALILEKRFSKALIGSSHPFGPALIPWGSHPLTDSLLSTRSLVVKHDGASFNRVEKTTLVARHPAALSDLHVCWRDSGASNCGECQKCIRTMATLHLLGVLKANNPFPKAFEADKLAALYLEDNNEEDFIREVLDLAQSKGDKIVADAAQKTLQRSAKLRPWVRFADNLADVPGLWKFAPKMRKLLVG